MARTSAQCHLVLKATGLSKSFQEVYGLDMASTDPAAMMSLYLQVAPTELFRLLQRQLGVVVRGSGNVFRDLGHKNADVEQFKAILAAEIIKALDREGLSVRAAHGRTGIAAADFSRIRNADLGRFTVDRLMSILNRLGSRVEVKVRVHRSKTAPHEARA